VKNITVSVPDEVYRAARITAAERGTSVSAMVAEFLESVRSDAASDPRAERRRLFDEIAAQNPGFSAADRLPREELYDASVRRHERPAL
jgi:plasmid stability protein